MAKGIPVRFTKNGKIEILDKAMSKALAQLGLEGRRFMLAIPWPLQPDPVEGAACPLPPNIVCPCYLQELPDNVRIQPAPKKGRRKA